jgi:pimeloyl-ACP methyl ester carboxylesterase
MRVNGAELDVLLSGQERSLAVVLLHAFPLSREVFAPLLPTLEAEFRVVAPDFRGFGGSPVGPEPVTVDLLAGDVLGILDHLGIRRAVLLGLSLGGYVALRVAEREPRRIWGLVLADTRSEGDDDDGRLRRAAGVRKVMSAGSAAYAEAALPALLGRTTLRDRPGVLPRLLALAAANPPAGIAAALMAMAARTSTTTSLPDFRFPVQVVVGEEDGVTPPGLARTMAARIPGARFAVVPAAGHLSCFENPAAFEAAVLPFLREMRDGPE